MQLLALTHQSTARANSVSHQVTSHDSAQHSTLIQPPNCHGAAVSSRKTDGAVVDDDDYGVPLLDTPAPRKRPPVPTQFDPVTTTYQPNGNSQSSIPKPSMQSLDTFFCSRIVFVVHN